LATTVYEKPENKGIEIIKYFVNDELRKNAHPGLNWNLLKSK